MKIASIAIVAVMAAAPLFQAHAQSYPTKPVRIMVGYPPGGGVDVGARIVGQGLSDVWGVQTIIDNRPGGTGVLATTLTYQAPPDGYTLMLCQIASHAITPARAKKLPFDHVRDFAFVSMVGTTPNVIVTHPT